MKFQQLFNMDGIRTWGARIRGVQFVISIGDGEIRTSYKMTSETSLPAKHFGGVHSSFSSAEEACKKKAKELVQ